MNKRSSKIYKLQKKNVLAQFKSDINILGLAFDFQIFANLKKAFRAAIAILRNIFLYAFFIYTWYAE